MKYIIIGKADRHNIPFSGHKINMDQMAVNEKEIMSIPDISGTIDERISALGGKIYTANEIKKIIEKWELIK